MTLIPLAERMRPKSLDELVGQSHLIGLGAPIREMLAKGVLPSMIFWGPPGTGKTTLAELMAQHSKRPFHLISAINSGVKDIRDIIEKTQSKNLFQGLSPIVFVDEIHRFNKGQQDALLSAVERGWISLIGATTENPSFEVNSALLSRCQVYIMEALSVVDLQKILDRALQNDVVLSQKSIQIKQYDALLRHSSGDARKLLNALELVVSANLSHDRMLLIDNAMVNQTLQDNLSKFDKSGEWHYDIASAFIKSIRGSDPNAAVYWLARMIDGGEDVKFIARRLLILASEDIGNANPTALVIANNAFQAVNVIGYPESRIVLSQCVIYLATSPKSNSAYTAIDKALELVKSTGDLPVPLHLRNAPTALMKNLNYGKDYAYAHNYPDHFIAQDFLPESIQNTILYEPANNAKENQYRSELKQKWKDRYHY